LLLLRVAILVYVPLKCLEKSGNLIMTGEWPPCTCPLTVTNLNSNRLIAIRLEIKPMAF